MNDFTREDLKDLCSWLSEIHHNSFDDVGCMIKKLQSLIDNYSDKTTLDKLKEKIEYGMDVCRCIGTKDADTALWAYQNVLGWIKEVSNDNQ